MSRELSGRDWVPKRATGPTPGPIRIHLGGLGPGRADSARARLLLNHEEQGPVLALVARSGEMQLEFVRLGHLSRAEQPEALQRARKELRARYPGCDLEEVR